MSDISNKRCNQESRTIPDLPLGHFKTHFSTLAIIQKNAWKETAEKKYYPDHQGSNEPTIDVEHSKRHIM